MTQYTHPVCGYLFPSDDPLEFDACDIARQLAEMEADPVNDPEMFEESYFQYLDLTDFDLIALYRSRAGY